MEKKDLYSVTPKILGKGCMVVVVVVLPS